MAEKKFCCKNCGKNSYEKMKNNLCLKCKILELDKKETKINKSLKGFGK